jgi:hypothetical protein
MCFLSELHMPLPAILRVTSDFVIDRTVRRALTDRDVDLDRIRTLVETASRNGIKLDSTSLEFALRERLNALVDQWALKPTDRDLLEMVAAVVALARVLPFEVDLWKVQNVYYQLLQRISGEAITLDASGPWLEHFLHLGERLGVMVPDDAVLAPCLPGHVEPVATRDDSCHSMARLSSAAHRRYRRRMDQQ